MSRKAIIDPHPLPDPEVLGPSVIRTFLKTAAAWGLTDEHICALMNINKAVLNRWRQGSPDSFDKERMLRLSYIFGIYKALQILIPQSADKWVLRPNTNKIFGGRAAISVMCEGPGGLRSVRRYLDAHLA